MTTPATPAHHGRAVGDIVRAAVGGEAKSFKYYDEDESHMVVLGRFVGAPAAGLTTWSTLTLHMAPNVFRGTDVRVELLGVARDDEERIANVLATSAFFVLKNGWVASPGTLFHDLVRMYVPDTTTPHVLWSAAQLWPDLVDGVEVEGFRDVHWLLATPVTDDEVEYLEAHGYDALDERLGDASVDLADLWRRSAVSE